MPTTVESFLFWVVTILCSGAGAYLGAYLKKKGENLATKEDFRELKEQTRDLAQTTREIEARIDDQVWNRQRQWEMKRDILLELVRSMDSFDQAIRDLSVKIKSRTLSQKGDENFKKALGVWEETSREFEGNQSLAALVVGASTQNAVRQLSRELRDITGKILDGSQLDAYRDRQRTVVMNLLKIQDLVRREIGITPLSREFSGTPSPDSQSAHPSPASEQSEPQ